MSITKTKKAKKNITFSEELYDWVETFVAALVAVVLIFTFVCRIVAVDGASMNKTLEHRDTLVISGITKAKAGDIVVFQQLEDNFQKPLIKRVIATEGQTVDIDFDTWTVTVDGEPLDEPYVNYIDGTSMRSGLIQSPTPWVKVRFSSWATTATIPATAARSARLTQEISWVRYFSE